jgi:hypothetical protein
MGHNVLTLMYVHEVKLCVRRMLEKIVIFFTPYRLNGVLVIDEAR